MGDTDWLRDQSVREMIAGVGDVDQDFHIGNPYGNFAFSPTVADRPDFSSVDLVKVYNEIATIFREETGVGESNSWAFLRKFGETDEKDTGRAPGSRSRHGLVYSEIFLCGVCRPADARTIMYGLIVGLKRKINEARIFEGKVCRLGWRIEPEVSIREAAIPLTLDKNSNCISEDSNWVAIRVRARVAPIPEEQKRKERNSSFDDESPDDGWVGVKIRKSAISLKKRNLRGR